MATPRSPSRLNMHGSICVIVKQFVEQNYGADIWREILNSAGHEGLVLSPIQNYPDEAVIAIIGAACEHLEIDQRTALVEVGKFATPQLIRFAKGMLHPSWKSFEVLRNLESLIHRTIRISNPDAEPATIQAFELSDSQFQIVYSSHRGLCALANGILQGLSEVFDESIEVIEDTCCQHGDPFCTFTVNKVVDNIDDAAADDRNSQSASSSLPEDSSNSDPYAMTTDMPISAAFDGEDDGEFALMQESETSGSGTSTMSSREPKMGQAPSQLIPLPKRIDRYSIHEVLGVGGMGVVYRGIDESLMRTVAVKTIKNPKIESSMQELFLAEARRLAKLNHPNVVRIYDVGKTGQRPYFVMEYLPGLTLLSRLGRGPLNLKVALRIFGNILDGVDAIHRLGMVHRDIKPGNVVLSDDLQKCHLLDFGLAVDNAPKHTPDRWITGTKGYIPPERIKGMPGDYRGDFFSLGCIGYEMFSGTTLLQLAEENPANRISLKEVKETHQWQQLPDKVRSTIRGMLHSDPEERLCDYKEIREKLEMMAYT